MFLYCTKITAEVEALKELKCQLKNLKGLKYQLQELRCHFKCKH